MQLLLLLALLAELLLLTPVEGVEQDAGQKGGEHRGDEDEDALVDRALLLQDRGHRHIADQKDRAAVDRPHIVERLLALDVVVKEDVAPAVEAVGHLGADGRIRDVVGAVEVVEVQVARVPLAHALGLEDEPLALGVHHIERRLLVVEPVGQRAVDRVVDILDIEGAEGLAVPLDRAADGVGPGAHVVDVGLRDRKPLDPAARREIQLLAGEGLAGAGDTLGLPRADQRELDHRLVFLVAEDVGLGVLELGELLREQGLELGLAAQGGLDHAFEQVEALAEALDGRAGHLPGGLLRHRKDDGAKDAKNQHNRQEQVKAPVLLVLSGLLFHGVLRRFVFSASRPGGRTGAPDAGRSTGAAQAPKRVLRWLLTLYYFGCWGVNRCGDKLRSFWARIRLKWKIVIVASLCLAKSCFSLSSVFLLYWLCKPLKLYDRND